MSETMTRRKFLKRNILMIVTLFFAQIFAKLIRDNPTKEAKYYKNLAG